jgi:UDP-N-acetylmuramoyl-tripeptide--D-alanyl-D-alanine ligase/murE/murF fusion protein
MKAGLEVLCHTAKNRNLRPVAVLGDMLELGKVSEEAHRTVGERVAKAGIAHLVTYGKAAKYIARGACENGMNEENITVLESDAPAEETAKRVREIIQKGDVVLFKASRAMALERIVNLL